MFTKCKDISLIRGDVITSFNISGIYNRCLKCDVYWTFSCSVNTVFSNTCVFQVPPKHGNSLPYLKRGHSKSRGWLSIQLLPIKLGAKLLYPLPPICLLIILISSSPIVIFSLIYLQHSWIEGLQDSHQSPGIHPYHGPQ